MYHIASLIKGFNTQSGSNCDLRLAMKYLGNEINKMTLNF